MAVLLWVGMGSGASLIIRTCPVPLILPLSALLHRENGYRLLQFFTYGRIMLEMATLGWRDPLFGIILILMQRHDRLCVLKHLSGYRRSNTAGWYVYLGRELMLRELVDCCARRMKSALPYSHEGIECPKYRNPWFDTTATGRGCRSNRKAPGGVAMPLRHYGRFCDVLVLRNYCCTVQVMHNVGNALFSIQYLRILSHTARISIILRAQRVQASV